MTESPKSLKRTLFLAVLAMNCFVVLLLAYTLSQARAQREREVGITVENLALLMDQNVSSTAQKLDLALQDLADALQTRMQAGSAPDPQWVNQVFAATRARLAGIADFRATDAAGIVIYGPDVRATAGVSYADRDFFVAHRKRIDSGLIVSNPILGRVTGAWVISFSRRYNDPGGKFEGVI